jgi:hypothetical protein
MRIEFVFYPRLKRAMALRAHAVQVIVSNGKVLPANRIVKGMGTGITPVSIKIEFRQG